MGKPREDKSIEPLGVLLAGGQGRRMGGGKPLRVLAGKRLIDRALEILGSVCPSHIVVTGDPESLPDLTCPVIADIWPERGPLAGLATAFLKTDAPWLMAFPVDAPLVKPELLRLLPGRAQGQKVVALQGPGGMEPLMALYSRQCLPQALELLDKGEHRLRMLLEVCNVRLILQDEVRLWDPENHSFLNVNRAEDLARAEEILANGRG